ncbi:MAG TPA: hypothetical protein VIW46_03795 [Acidimicrobiia bacterium]|jgi:hypothetical protein
MADNTAARNRMMTVVGLVLALGAAALMVWTDIEVGILSLVAIVGILLIGTSRRDRRLLG